MSDQLLMERWTQKRDAEAFETMVNRHAPMVYGICKRMMSNATDAEEAVQETFMTLMGAHSRTGAYLGAWLHRVAVNTCLNRLRSTRRRQAREQAFMKARPDAVNPEWNDISPLLDEAVTELPEKLRRPLVIHFYEGESHANIAVKLGIPRQTVTYRIEKGTELLRQSLGRRGISVAGTVLAGLMATNLTADASAMPVAIPAAVQAAAMNALATGTGFATSASAALLAAAAKLAVAVLAIVIAVSAAYSYWHGGKPESQPVTKNAMDTANTIHNPSAVAENPASIQATTTAAPDPSSVSASAQADIKTPNATGTVLDPSGNPAANVIVHFLYSSGAGTGYSVDNGAFTLPLKTGISYQLRAIDTARKLISAGLDVTPAEEGVHDLVLQLESGSSLGGTLVDETGAPVINALIDLQVLQGDPFLTQTPWGNSLQGLIGEVLTDAEGRFMIPVLYPSEYTVTAETVDMAHSQPSKVKLMRGADEPDLHLVLNARLQTITGHVTDEQGNPLAESSVCSTGRIVSTDSNGWYGMTQKPKNSIQVAVNHPVFCDASHVMEPGESVEDFVLRRAPMLRGSVIREDTGAPVMGCTVEVKAKTFSTTTPCTNGQFELTLHEAPEAAVMAYAPGLKGKGTIKDIQCGQNPTEMIVRMHPSDEVLPAEKIPEEPPRTEEPQEDSATASLRGELRLAGVPVSGMIFLPRNSKGKRRIMSVQGAFTIDGVPEGASPITVEIQAPVRRQKEYALTFSPRRTETLAVDFPEGNAAVEGNIDFDIQPEDNVTLTLLMQTSQGDEKIINTLNCSGGAYHISALPAGTGNAHLVVMRNGMSVLGRDLPFETRPGQTTLLNFVSGAGTIEGEISSMGSATRAVGLVTRETPLPEGGVFTESEADALPRVHGWMQVDGNTFTISNLLPGEYNLIILEMPNGPQVESARFTVHPVTVRDGETVKIQL